MWKRKRTLKEEYGTLGHFLRGDNDCHYLGDLYIEGTNFYRHREWRGVRDTAYAFARWLQTWVKMAGLIGRDPVRMVRAFWKYRWLSAYLATPHDGRQMDRGRPRHGAARRPDGHRLHGVRLASRRSGARSAPTAASARTSGPSATIAFDYTLPKHIMLRLPRLLRHQHPAARGVHGADPEQEPRLVLRRSGRLLRHPAATCARCRSWRPASPSRASIPDIGNCWLTTNNPCDANMMDNAAMYRALSERRTKRPCTPFVDAAHVRRPDDCKELGVHEAVRGHPTSSRISSASRSTGTPSSEGIEQHQPVQRARRPSAGTSTPRRTTARSTPSVRACSASTSTSRAATSTSSRRSRKITQHL